MESTELELDVADLESPDPTNEVPKLSPHDVARPSRMPSGTIAPPIDDDDLDALRSQAHRHRSTQAWSELAQTLHRIIDLGQLQDVLDEQETLDLYAQLGELEGDTLGHVDGAIDAWRKVVAIDPSDLRALGALEDLFARDGRWEESLDVLEKRALVLDDEHQRREALLRAARTWEDRFGDDRRAAEIYERVRGSEPSDAIACERLAEIYRRDHKWAELVEILLERSESLADVAQQVAILHDVAKIYERELDDQESAFYVLQAAFNRPHAREHTGRELERLAAATNLWQELRESMEAALRAEPDLPVALASVAKQQRERGSWNELIATLQRQAAAEPSPEQRTELYIQLADLLETQAKDAAGAIAAYEHARELEPANRVALRALEALYEQTEQHDKYLAVLEAQLDATHADAERVSLYERIAAAWEEHFGKLDRAAEAYEQVIALDPRNVAAYHLLARLYKQAGNHEALVETHRKHIAATTDVATRIELYVAMGQICATNLHDIDRAVEAYNDALALDADEVHALDALARIYEQLAAWDHAVDVLGRLAKVGDDARNHELYWRMGRIQYRQLGQTEGAEASLLRGLALEPSHVPTMDVLIELYSDRGDWLKAAQMMVRAEAHARVAVDKVRLLCEAANIYLYKLHAAEQAKPLYAAAIALDPEHVDAGRPLAGLYFDAGQWAELAPVIDMLCRKAGSHKQHELYFRAARCAAELGDQHKALGYYQTAYDLDPTHLPTLTGRADLLFAMQHWDDAGKLYQNILVQHRDGQRDVDVARIYNRLGMVRQALGERKKALHMFDKALELDPHHRETLHTVIELHAQLGDWEAVVRAKRGLAETADDREKAKLLDEIGALYHGRLQNAPKAAAAYLEALEVTPDAHQLLQKLLDLYIDTKQWKQAVETIERFVALETDPFRRGVYFHAAATVCRDELKSLDEAVDYYDCALDSFFANPDQLDDQQLPRALMSFEAIDGVLTTKRDWKAQERAYRDMIKRLPGGHARFHKLQVGLLDGLAEVYRSRLKQFADAATAFELAQQMDPDNALRGMATDRAEILAELYVVAGLDRADKAVEQHQLMLQREPFKYDSYQALAHIYRATQQYDKHWCLCSTLAFLKKADADEQHFYDQYKPRGLVKAKHGASADSWAKLAHADENRYISAIFGACWQGVAAMNAFSHKDFGVKREDRRQLHGDSLMFSKLFVYVAQALNVTLPDVYLVDDSKPADIQLANAIEKNELCPSFVVRPHLLQGKTEREVAFVCARRLAFLRPEYYLRMLLPTNTELKVAVLSAIAMVQPRFAVPANLVATVQQYLPKMQKRMPPHALEQLGAVVQRFIQATPEIDVAKWGHAVDAASHRAGFVTCGDLEVAARTVAADPAVVGGPSIKDRVKELVLFSVSEDYFAIRAQMGLAI
ncbi:MAG TPA: tetratricopeptide repeat protein, partial [Kofleriaceae bacterium]|nr:tetratricopeptide repeat protein [Kofleriaceae bacterium]